MKIIKLETSNDCGGFKSPKGHLDTQMFPECAGTEADRDIVPKTVRERKRKDKKKKPQKKTKCDKCTATFNLFEYRMAKKKDSEFEHSPKEHGFMDECMEKHKDKDDPGAYCASIVDTAKGTTDWRKGPRD